MQESQSRPLRPSRRSRRAPAGVSDTKPTKLDAAEFHAFEQSCPLFVASESDHGGWACGSTPSIAVALGHAANDRCYWADERTVHYGYLIEGEGEEEIGAVFRPLNINMNDKQVQHGLKLLCWTDRRSGGTRLRDADATQIQTTALIVATSPAGRAVGAGDTPRAGASIHSAAIRGFERSSRSTSTRRATAIQPVSAGPFRFHGWYLLSTAARALAQAGTDASFPNRLEVPPAMNPNTLLYVEARPPASEDKQVNQNRHRSLLTKAATDLQALDWDSSQIDHWLIDVEHAKRGAKPGERVAWTSYYRPVYRLDIDPERDWPHSDVSFKACFRGGVSRSGVGRLQGRQVLTQSRRLGLASANQRRTQADHDRTHLARGRAAAESGRAAASAKCPRRSGFAGVANAHCLPHRLPPTARPPSQILGGHHPAAVPNRPTSIPHRRAIPRPAATG